MSRVYGHARVRDAGRPEFTITPEELLRRLGWQFVRRRNWLSLKTCPFCGGGRSGDRHTFVVHAEDGNYSCQRSKCGASGSFWRLMETQHFNPREFLTGDAKGRNRGARKKKFVYGK